MTYPEPEIDPVTQEWMDLARREVPGDTPEEKLENFMAEMTYLPPDILEIMRGVMAEEFGVSKTRAAAGE